MPLHSSHVRRSIRRSILRGSAVSGGGYRWPKGEYHHVGDWFTCWCGASGWFDEMCDFSFVDGDGDCHCGGDCCCCHNHGHVDGMEGDDEDWSDDDPEDEGYCYEDED